MLEVNQGPDVARIRRRWTLVFIALALAFAATIVVLNSTLYSAKGFVGAYLDALARHDANGALGMAGVRPEANANDALLRPQTLGDIGTVDFVSDTDAGGGTHSVVYAVGGTPITFEVRYTGMRLGLISTWSFSTSPTAVLEVTPVSTASFDANGVTLTGQNGPSVESPFSVMVPSVLALSHSSVYLEAAAETVRVTVPGTVATASVTPKPSARFVSTVQKELDRVLDECATQQVLQPTGCPFGERIENRVVGTPKWSIAAYPKVTIVPASAPETWEVPSTPGTAHLTVEVQSLFDGTLSTYDQDSAFTVGYVITFTSGGGLSIIGQ